jgi:multidrug efflux pump subunit AcrB
MTMKISEFSVKNSLLVNLLSVFILIVGLIAISQTQREAFPSISLDTVIITTAYPGATAEDVEKLVTTPIEKELRGISGIKTMRSASDEGRSEISLEIDPEARDRKKVVDDIQKAVDRVRDLPEEIKEDPLVVELASDEFPVIEISLGGDFSEKERRIHAERL